MRKKIKLSGIAVVLLGVLGIAFYPAISAHGACPADMISYWKLDETTGPTYADLFGKNNGVGAPGPAAAPGIIGGAQYFDGSDDQGIEVPASRSFSWIGSESFSIELWVKPDGAPAAGNQVLIGREEVGTGMQWWLGYRGNAPDTGRAFFRLQDGTGPSLGLFGGPEGLHVDGEWHHLVAVKDGRETTLWVDGVPYDTATADFDRGFGSNTPLYLGNLDSAFRFKGWMDEVALYDRALTEGEIQAHYDAGLAGVGVASLRPAPTPNAGPNQTGVKATSTVALDGSGSTPGYPGSPIEEYLWVLTAGPSGAFNDATSATPTFLIDAPGAVGAAGATLTFQLTVTAQDRQQDVDTVTVGVVALVAPVAVAGQPQTVTAGDRVELDGSGSSDADGDIVSYAWVQTEGSISVTLSDAAAANPAFTAPQLDVAEAFTFELTVTDDDGLTATDTVDVIVDPAGTPTPAPAGGGGGGGCFINSLF